MGPICTSHSHDSYLASKFGVGEGVCCFDPGRSPVIQENWSSRLSIVFIPFKGGGNLQAPGGLETNKTFSNTSTWFIKHT